MRIGILGAGGIAATMAETIRPLEGVESYAVAARDLERARAFAEKWGFERAYGSYEEMLADDQVDLVYIAVPHSHHHRWTMAALEEGRNVLCEKAFAANTEQAREMIRLAESKKLLLTEAIWTRYMPSRQMIREIIDSGDIGEVMTVSSNLGYRIDMNERMVKPELAGGCLLDLTVYTLNFSSMVLGNDIKRIAASMVPTETGVDGQDSVMIEYAGGQMANMFTTMYTLTDRRGLICGREGFITVENINNPQKITVWEPDRNHPAVRKELVVPEQITGYEYEVLACKKALEEGRIECPDMPHSETLEIMGQMDQIRAQFGIVFPFEKN
ncbi:MAG TPA: Gfo/Idh/MocA family oxidoreductase [Candidatus Scatomonas pullistercoris]|uniref:Gfo/Idh/MocA family oxidoreductase n=1 Tax=Candidatus Scatomonas pullistercoris TaxID=2840920 RepID=A0A9D1P418_9FIRM|nr:Gfo/Idh/MocA family oxidoreductase [Candidatus Scatomonas pullistercoris]